MRRLWGGGVALATLVATACGGSTEDPAAEDSREAFIPQLVAAACDVAECCEKQGQGSDAVNCEARWTNTFSSAFATTENVDYDPEAAGRCLSAMRQFFGSCAGGSLVALDACQDVVTGKLPDGAACTYSVECAAPQGGFASCLNSVCVQSRRGGEGDSCAWTCSVEPGGATLCSSGSLLGNDSCFTNDGLYCGADQRCAPLAKPGEACAEARCVAGYQCVETCVALEAEGGPCEQSSDCASELFCSANVCRRRLAPGELCDDPSACAEGAQCQGGVCRSRAFVCAAPAEPGSGS